uniref:P2-like prophage tail protein X n=1 Tax=Candidatus Kentrum sp. LFY TaxID=2126342 RepID=A0A450W6R4_9GAMM|nr:MAG: P2-like prophage tail protein X [Candidatus Kentron sp. LFY]
MQYRTRDGDMLDAICWKYYGFADSAIEAVLEANRDIGLSHMPAVLSAGVVITLPKLPEPAQVIPTVRLWD